MRKSLLILVLVLVGEHFFVVDAGMAKITRDILDYHASSVEAAQTARDAGATGGSSQAASDCVELSPPGAFTSAQKRRCWWSASPNSVLIIISRFT